MLLIFYFISLKIVKQIFFLANLNFRILYVINFIYFDAIYKYYVF